MGILKAAAYSLSDVASEQWKEFFYCDSLPQEILLVKGQKHISEHSSNNRTDDQVITPGSIIAVADGQCALVVSQGKVIAVYEESGEHVYENPDQATGVKGFLKETGRRISFGGGVQSATQRVYYFNTKEVMGVPFTSKTPVTLQTGAFQSTLTLSGVFSYRVCDPAAFYKMVTGNVALRYERERLNSQLATELITALMTAVSHTELFRSSDIGLHTDDLITELKAVINPKWREKRGLEAVSIAFDAGIFSGSDNIAHIQETEVYAKGMPAGSWICSCGQNNDGNFCVNCGAKRQ